MGHRTDDAQQTQGNGLQEATDELMNSMTVMYMMIQEALAGPEEMESLSRQLSMSSSFLDWLSLAHVEWQLR